MKFFNSLLLLVIFVLIFPVKVYALRKPGDKVIVGKTTFMIWGGAKAGIMPKGAITSHD